MIGNDVVDIELASKESNWQRSGFLDKLFMPHEQALINNAPVPEIVVWTLWSMKEAAYKIYNRQTKIRAFIPKHLQCFEERVHCNGWVYHTKTSYTDSMIHTIATPSREELDKVVEIDDAEIVKDTYGFPYIYGKKKLQPVSVSHHGRYYKVVVTL